LAEVQKILHDLETLEPMLIKFGNEEQRFYPVPPTEAKLLTSYIRTLERENSELATRARMVVTTLKKRLDKHDGYNLQIADDFLSSITLNP
jgi:hypothetical protein